MQSVFIADNDYEAMVNSKEISNLITMQKQLNVLKERIVKLEENSADSVVLGKVDMWIKYLELSDDVLVLSNQQRLDLIKMLKESFRL